MEKLFKLSVIQKITTAFCVLLVIAGVLFAVVTRLSYSKISLDTSCYDNAKLYLNEETQYYIDEMNKISVDEAVYTLDEYDYIFKIQCNEMEHCYSCTKFNVKVMDTIKGSIDETGNDIVLYQWAFFEETDDGIFAFNSPDNSMLLKTGKEYLIFCKKKDYYLQYQKKLECNEYSLGLMGTSPCAFVLDDSQSDYIDISKDKKYGDIEDLYYTCFSKESLENINSLAESIIKHYCGN